MPNCIGSCLPLDPPAAWTEGTRRMGNNSFSILPFPWMCPGDDIDLLSWGEMAADRIGWRSVLLQLRADEEQLLNPAEDRRAGRRERQASCLPETSYRCDYCDTDSRYRIRLIGLSRRCCKSYMNVISECTSQQYPMTSTR